MLVVEEDLGERLAELGFADAGRAAEDERADGAVGILQAAAAAADGVGDGSTASSWPMTRWWSRSSSTSSLAFSASIMRVTGMPVQALTTSAISSGPTSWRRRRCFSPFGFVGAGLASASTSFWRASCADVELVEFLVGGFVNEMPEDRLGSLFRCVLVVVLMGVFQPLRQMLDIAEAHLFAFPLLAEAGEFLPLFCISS